ncbi:MAG: F0F1 ATP synthase subunit epsilon [Candidatus Aminicenantes bacterium]|jgi:F-type H+-transporting ATPase subunit epsilon|nr:F0F1 ATP synthase subunit epsilon [Candidatus Aminicenantes bacterium]
MNSGETGKYHLRIISPEKLLVDVEVTEVQVPGLDGYLGIWPGHRPLNACLGNGEVIYRTLDNREGKVEIKRGIIKVENDKIIILTGMSND